jgi:hypothetical protein
MAVWHPIKELTRRSDASYFQGSEGHGRRLGGPYNTQDWWEKHVSRITRKGGIEIAKPLAELVRVVALFPRWHGPLR